MKEMEEGERENGWERIFSRFGKLVGVHLPKDYVRRRSRGYTFVTFYYEQEAFSAANCLHGRRLDGRIVSLAWAKSSFAITGHGRRDSSVRQQRAEPIRYFRLDLARNQRVNTQESYASVTKVSHPPGKNPIPSLTAEAPLITEGSKSLIQTDTQQVDLMEQGLALALIAFCSQEVSVLRLVDVF
ncbi:uncharacterized protein LOC131225344 [Magnolia sinica]|uniref:uncharacterized protein LOC131225344 n=1 Tax=Magnolia sinica TaxID=86752 RepID=UPI002659D119|nr:uncharacterized protein LOC131225344 [Magnolia sinica]